MPPSSLSIARNLRSLLAAALLLPLPMASQAQDISFATPPLEMARAAVGEWPGSAVVGVWREGRTSFAGVSDGKPLDAAEVEGEKSRLYEIGSISKVFTGLLLAQAVERGELQLDDSLGKLLDGRVAFASAQVAGITLRQLVTHTSCMPRLPADIRRGWTENDPYRHYDRTRLWKAVGEMSLDKAPPCAASYSNVGFAVLGELLAEKYGKPWEQLVRERIAMPLGMKDTVQSLGDKAPRLAPGHNGRQATPPWDMLAFAGAGALRSTAADMLLFGRALAAGRHGPLGAAAERLVQPLARFDGDIGYAIFIRGPAERRTWLHNGGTGGHRSQLVVAPDTGEVLIVLAANAEAPVYRVGSQVVAARYEVAAGEAKAPDAARLNDYVGVFRVDGNAALTFVVQDGVLHARYTGQPFAPLRAAGPDEFTVGNKARLRFEREGDKVQAVRLSQAGAELKGVRTAEPAPARATLPMEQLQPYVGRYQAGQYSFDVQAHAGQLSVKLGSQSRFFVFPAVGQADRFDYDVVKASIQFERYPGGPVKALVLHQDGQMRAEKVE